MQRSHHLPPKTIYDGRRCLAVVQRKPGVLRQGAPFLDLSHAFRPLQDRLWRKPGGDREMLGILTLVLHHAAVEPSLAERVPTKSHVPNLLHRWVGDRVIAWPPRDTPQATALHPTARRMSNAMTARVTRSLEAGKRHDPVAGAIAIMAQAV